LEVVIDTVNARFEEDDEADAIKMSLEHLFGSLTGYIAVRLRGWPFVIQPKAAAH
jgi:hypothetical protein